MLDLIQVLISAAVYLALFLTPVLALSIIANALLSLPLKRRERARLFLDLMETALAQGKPVEQTLISVAQCQDPAPGVRFHLLAAYLEKGARLGTALKEVPRLLPPQITAMLQAGERIGDIRKVLPACRRTLDDSVSQTRGALNYLLVMAFVVTPFTIFVPMILAVLVIPKFKEVFLGMLGGQALPAFTIFVFEHGRAVFYCQTLVMMLVWLAMITYVGGPRLRHWVRPLLGAFPDQVMYLLPWRRKRLQRDFSTILSVLLDSNVPEADAVLLAAESTSNAVMIRRANEVRTALTGGTKLPEAIRRIDGSGELQWRLTNALQRGHDFLRALAGWHEALDARAFQLEQSAAQIATSSLVLLNGTIVAGVVIAIFLALTDLISEVALW